MVYCWFAEDYDALDIDHHVLERHCIPMDDRRFDSVTRAMANGASRRSVIKALLGLGALAGAGSVLHEADAARRGFAGPPILKPTPTPPISDCDGLSCNGDCCDPDETICCNGFCCNGTCHESQCCPPGWSWCADVGCCDGQCIGGTQCCANNAVCNGECCGDDAYCCLKEDGSKVCRSDGQCCSDAQCDGGTCDSQGFCS